MKKLIAAACVALAACAAPDLPRAAELAPVSPKPYALIDQRAPAFSAPLVGGGVLSDASLKGHYTIIEFWGLWCEDSMADINQTRALASAVAQDPDLRFVTVHVDQRYGRWNSAADYVAEEHVKYPIALDPDQRVKQAFKVQATPTYLVVDPQGIIRAARGDLRLETNPDGGVKTLIKQIAEIRRAQTGPN